MAGLSPHELDRTREVPDNKRYALSKLISRILEISSRDTDQILLHALGDRALKTFTFGDVFDLANADAFKRAVQSAGVDVPSVSILRVVDMIGQITVETEPCENRRCGEYPIYERGGVIRKDEPGQPCLYCGYEPAATIAAAKTEPPKDTSKRIIGGDYQIEGFIAEGAIGRTYLATDLTVDKPVCVKHCFKLSAKRQTNLLEEARKMWDLRHHGIPAIRRVIRLEDGSLAMVMSFIPGETLEALVKRKGALHAESVAWVLERLLNILQYLHVHGVIHGDVKPANIIVNEEDYSISLVDFGLSLVKPTEATRPIGHSDHFAPPEQTAGEPLLPESDHYALGKVALYMLNGGDLDHVNQDFIPSAVTPHLCDFIGKLTQKDVRNRPQFANRLFDEIQRLRRTVFGRMWFNKGENPLRGVS